MVTGFFHAHFWPSTPSFTPFRLLYPFSGAGHASDKCLHSVRTVLLHLVRDMTIDVQRKGGGGVAQIALHGFDIVPGPDRGHGVAVPEIVKRASGRPMDAAAFLNAR